LLARLLASRLALCVVVFVFTPLLMQGGVHAIYRVGSCYPFFRLRLLRFCGSCFGALSVVVCWMFGECSWLVGGTKVSGS